MFSIPVFPTIRAGTCVACDDVLALSVVVPWPPLTLPSQ